MNKVTIISSPVTDRMVNPGDEGEFSPNGDQIRVNGNWFDFTNKWKVKPKEISDEE